MGWSDQKGWTLLEVVVILLVVGIVLALVVVGLPLARGKGSSKWMHRQPQATRAATTVDSTPNPGGPTRTSASASSVRRTCGKRDKGIPSSVG